MVWLFFIVGLVVFIVQQSKSFKKIADNADPEVLEIVIAQASILGLEPRLLEAICLKESSGHPIVGIGLHGEIGILQVTPIAMRQVDMFLDENSDLADQAYVGGLYLKWLLDQDKGEDWAIRAYNAGPHGADLGRSQQYLRQVRDFYALLPVV